jgi:TolB-like protein
MSNDKDNEYFSDGITEDIITRLSQITGLKVIARTSVMRFKNSTESIKQIAADLGVSAILEGSVQKNGNKVRITAQLIDAGNDKNLWADKYDRELKDIFQIQSDVSEVIALHLNASLTELQKSRIEKKPTENLDAYNFYLQGNYLWHKHTVESMPQAIDFYNKATAIDSNFALAYAATAIAYVSRGQTGSKSEDWVESIRFNAERAISLDSNLAASHTALGEYYYAINHLPVAMKEFDKAIELDPNYAHAWNYKSWLYYVNGENEKALSFAGQEVILDPLSSTYLLNKAKELALLGQTSEAMELIKKAELLEPEQNQLYNFKLMVYFLAGDYDTWMQLVKTYYDSSEMNHYDLLKYQSLYYAVKGNKQKSILLRDSCKLLNGEDNLWLNAGCKYWLSEKDEAFQLLKDSLAIASPIEITNSISPLMTEFYLNALRSDSRFEEIKKLIGWKPLP